MGNRNSIYSTVDSKNGNISYEGPLEITKGDHSNMPPRTDAYLPEEKEPHTGMYDRGHINASSLSPYSGNGTENVAPMHSDLNRRGGAYYSMEQGERAALQNGATIDSTKTAIVNANPGDKPEAFMVSDNVTYSDGHTESVHHSFTNASYTEHQAWNDQSVALPDTFDAPNPGDTLSSSMSSGEYADLMENTDAELPGIAEDYAAADFSGTSNTDSVAFVSESNASDGETSDTASDAAVSADEGGGADCSLDD